MNILTALMWIIGPPLGFALIIAVLLLGIYLWATDGFTWNGD